MALTWSVFDHCPAWFAALHRGRSLARLRALGQQPASPNSRKEGDASIGNDSWTILSDAFPALKLDADYSTNLVQSILQCVECDGADGHAQCMRNVRCCREWLGCRHQYAFALEIGSNAIGT